MKKTILIFLFTAAAAAAAVSLYLYFGNGELPALVSQKPPAEPTNQAKPKTEERFKIVSSKPALAFWLSGDGGEIFYVSEERKILKIDSTGREEEVFSQPLYDVAAVRPSPDGEETIIGFGRPALWSRFRVADRSWKPILGENILSAAWVGEKIALIKKIQTVTGVTGNDLAIYDPKKESETKILSLAIEDAEILGGSGNKIIVATRPTAFFESLILSIDAAKKTIDVIVPPAKGLWARFSGPSGEGIVSKKQSLSFVAADGRELISVPLISLPSKCGWRSATSVICAAANLSNQLPLDDYLKKNFYSSDEFFEISVGGAASSKIFSPEGAVDADELFVAGQKAFFINRYNGRIYSLEL